MEDFEKKVSTTEPMEAENTIGCSDSSRILRLLRRFLAVQQRRAEAYANAQKTQNLGPSQLEARSQKTMNQMQLLIDICPRILSVDEDGKSMSLALKRVFSLREKLLQDLSKLAKLPREDLRMEAENTNQVGN